MELAIIIVTSIICLAIGFFFGGIPFKTDQMTDQQNKYQQALGIVGLGIVIVLMFTKQDLASWIVIIAMLLGVLIAKIPPIHRWLVKTFPIFEPKKPDSPLTRPRRKK
jgi:cell division protein FtsW (lipid II flippase)